MKNYFPKIICFAAAAAFLFFSCAADAALMLRQPSVQLFLKQGQEFSGGIILENVSGAPVTVKTDFADMLDKDGKPVKHACSKWIKLAESEFVIPAKSIKDLRFTAIVPKDARGGYWTGLVYSYYSGKVKGPDDITLNIRMNIEEPIEITVMDTAEKKLSSEKLDVSISTEALSIRSTLKNAGNIFMKVNPEYLLVNSEGRVIKALKTSSFKTYPGEKYSMEGTEKIDLPKGRYSLIAIFGYEEQEPLVEQKYFEIK